MSIPDELPPADEKSPLGIRSGVPDCIQHTNGKISKVAKQELLASDSDIPIPEVNNNIYIQDDSGEWWYVNEDRRYKAKERICSSCGKKEIIRVNTKTELCKSCALTGLPKSEEHIYKIGMSNKGKGKGITHAHGYILIKKEDHPNADGYGYVPEHRLVMESIIGRYLLPEEIVHHIDNNRSNNHPNNLWLFSNRSEHARFHNIDNLNTKKPNYVYLAGNISQNVNTYLWRETTERLLKKERLFKKIVIVNPCVNKFNKSVLGFKGTGDEFIKNVVSKSQHILRPKDYQLIRMCNMMVVNLVTGTDEKPLIGTLQELCWAKDIFNIPIIGITYGEDTAYTNHPWIDECCSAKVETVEEAVDLIKTFFLDY